METPAAEEPMETGETAAPAPKTPLVFRQEGEEKFNKKKSAIVQG